MVRHDSRQRQGGTESPIDSKRSVIDHITAGNALNVLRILGITGISTAIVSVVMNVPSKRLAFGRKDIVKIEDRELVPAEVDKIALIARRRRSTSYGTTKWYKRS